MSEKPANKLETDRVPKGLTRAGAGRPAGAQNKMTRDLKEMILGALDKVGGLEYLAERAADPKTASAFLTLVGKTLPMTLKGEGEEGAIKSVLEVRFVDVVKPEK